jgi:hypothetical protein
MTNEPGKSDRPVVPEKTPNNAPLSGTAEGMEGRGLAKGNLQQQNASRTPRRMDAPSALERVRQAAEKDKKLRFTALLHHIYNLEMLRTSYFSLKKEASPGVDGERWRHYGEGLEANLQDLSERLKRGAYRAKPVRRVFIPTAPTNHPICSERFRDFARRQKAAMRNNPSVLGGAFWLLSSAPSLSLDYFTRKEQSANTLPRSAILDWKLSRPGGGHSGLSETGCLPQSFTVIQRSAVLTMANLLRGPPQLEGEWNQTVWPANDLRCGIAVISHWFAAGCERVPKPFPPQISDPAQR